MKSVQILKHIQIAEEKINYYQKYIDIQKRLSEELKKKASKKIDSFQTHDELKQSTEIRNFPDAIECLRAELEIMDLEKKISATQQYVDMYTSQLLKFKNEFYEIGLKAEKEFMTVYNSKKTAIKNKLPEISRLVETGEFDSLKVNVKIELFEKIQEL